MKRYGRLFIACLALVALDANALSCRITSEQDLVERYSHIFFAMVTAAEFVPVSADTPRLGKVIAMFEVTEILKGDPIRVPHIEAKVREADEAWPAVIHLGRRYLIFSDDGPAQFSECSELFRDRERENWCLEYQVRKRVGQAVVENRMCEAVHILTEMERRGVRPESDRDDLEGLRLEWVNRFGVLPE